jgi:zinc transporter
MYGSDVHGLVWGYRFAPNEPAAPITLEAAVEWLAVPDSRHPGEFFWLLTLRDLGEKGVDSLV